VEYQDLIDRTRVYNKPLMQEYVQWVNDTGQITAFASSVLKEFIEEKGYTISEYEILEKEMRDN